MMSTPTTTSDQIKTSLSGGLIPAVPVMFDSTRNFHATAHEAYVGYIRTQAIAGVAVWAHTGRGLLLDADTRRRVINDWRAGLPGKTLIAGVGSNSKKADPERATNEAIAMASLAAEHGADALLVYPPSWLRHQESPDRLIVDHHRRLAGTGLPLVLFYLYEAAGGILYSPAVLEELLSLPEVIGIKMATLDSVLTYQDVSRRLKQYHPEKLLITGEDRFLGYSLRRGANAALIGMGAICCDLQAELIKANAGGDAEGFLALSDLVDTLAETIFVQPMEGYIKRLLLALVHLGVIPLEAANDPWGPPLSPQEFDTIGRTLDALMAVEQLRGRA